MRRLARLAACGWAALLALLAGPRPAPAGGPDLPTGLLALPETAAEAGAAERALELLARAASDDDSLGLRQARTLLRAGGAAALKRVSALLLSAGPGDARALHGVQVLAASPEPALDAVLTILAAREDAALRAAVADALGLPRTAQGLAALVGLARDPLPGVRAAALRALFARDDRPAREARTTSARDADPELEALRLRLLRLRGDGGEAVLRAARQGWEAGRTPAERLAAGRLLCTPAARASTAELLALVEEAGNGPVAAAALRALAGRPCAGYDPVQERWVAVDAAVEALGRPDLEPGARAALIDRAVDWLARPVPMDPLGRDPIPELALRRRLPEEGAALLPALLRRFEPGGFAAPRDGATLLAELAPDVAYPALVRLLGAERPQAVRAAASGALRRLGVLRDEALARRLTAPGEEASIRRDALATLGQAEAPWAVPLLGSLLGAADAETREAAADALEERPEPEARRLLEEFLFTGPCPDHRLAARLATALAPWDEAALALFDRALLRGRAPLRSGALMLAARQPLPRLVALLPRLRAHEPRLRGAAEVEAWVPALLRGAPAEGLAWIRAHWDDAPVGSSLASTRCRLLAALDHVRAPEHLPAVVDLALEKAGAAADAALLEHAADGLSGRRGARDADLDAFFRRLLEGRGLEGGEETRDEVAAAAVSALEEPGRGDLTAVLLPLLLRLAPDEERTHRTVAVLRALEHQPWPPQEHPVLALALDGTLPPPVRAAAARLLRGRVSAEGRERLLLRLLEPDSAESDAHVLLSLAAAAGTGGGPDVAERLRAALEGELRSFYAAPGALDPFAERLDVLPQRVQALAAGVAHTGQAAALDALVGLLVDPSFAPWADRALSEAAPTPAGAGLLGALEHGAPARVLRLEHAAQEASLLVPEVAMLAQGLKALGDEGLSQSLARVLDDPVGRTARCAFPDAWFGKLAALLHAPRTGDLERSAAVLEAWVERAEPHEGPFDAWVLEERLARRARGGGWAAAAEAADGLRRLRARRGYDLVPGEEQRGARLSAAAAAYRAAAQAGPTPEAAAALRAAVEAQGAAVGDDAAALCALALAAAEGDLDLAEALAARALALERRSDAEESLGAVAAWAEIRLRRGHAAEAASRLERALDRAQRDLGGRPHLLLAQAHAQAGDRPAALRALRTALMLEPSLEEDARRSPRLAPLAAGGLLERAIQAARAASAAGEEE